MILRPLLAGRPATSGSAIAGVLLLPVAADGRRVAARGFPHEVLGVPEVRPVAWVAAPHCAWPPALLAGDAAERVGDERGLSVGSGRPAARPAAAIAAAALRTVASFNRSAR